MSKLNEGEVEIILNGTPRVLRPTLNAMQALSRSHNGLAGVRDALVRQDVDAVCNVLFHGMHLKEADRKDLPKVVWKNGITGELLISLIKYVAILGNGGKPLEESEDGDGDGEAAEAGEGNL
jgi:hypothetical protein